MCDEIGICCKTSAQLKNVSSFFFQLYHNNKKCCNYYCFFEGCDARVKNHFFFFQERFQVQIFFAIVVSFLWAVICGNYLGNFETMWEEVPSHDAFGFFFLQLGPISSIKLHWGEYKVGPSFSRREIETMPSW